MRTLAILMAVVVIGAATSSGDAGPVRVASDASKRGAVSQHTAKAVEQTPQQEILAAPTDKKLSGTKQENLGPASPVWTNWIQAVSAALVMLMTFFLWRLSAKQTRILEANAQETARSVALAKQSADAAKVSADAATRGADLSEQALVITQRARVSFLKYVNEVSYASDGKILGYKILARWQNVGATSAENVQIGYQFFGLPAHSTDEPDVGFHHIAKEPPFTLGPLEIQRTRMEQLLPFDLIVAIWRGETRGFFWSGLAYDDVFAGRFEGSHRHHVCVCSELIVTNDPSAYNIGDELRFSFKHYDGYRVDTQKYPT